MLVLSSGRVIDLLTSRAKYHALKNNGPQQEAEHKALYTLVDIIYRNRDENGKPKLGWTEYDYVFSGYTLADIHLAKDWSQAEKAELHYWVTQNTQKLYIETARRRLVTNQLQLSLKSYSAPESLYSSLYERIETMTLQQAEARQWMSTINNMQQLGIRKEEIIW